MNESIYFLSDGLICEKLGAKVKESRVHQNISQKALAEASGVSLSTIIKIEKGTIGAFDNLLRVLRELRLLDPLEPFMEEDELTPQEYFEMQERHEKKRRQRASARRS